MLLKTYKMVAFFWKKYPEKAKTGSWYIIKNNFSIPLNNGNSVKSYTELKSLIQDYLKNVLGMDETEIPEGMGVEINYD